MAPLLDLDRALIEAAPAFEHPWLTAVFVVLSAWWVKGPLLVALGLCSDLWRRRLPVAFAAAAAATGAASLVTGVLKETFARARPPVDDPGLGSLTAIPGNPSFPSGHSATAFAAATAIAILCPGFVPPCSCSPPPWRSRGCICVCTSRSTWSPEGSSARPSVRSAASRRCDSSAPAP